MRVCACVCVCVRVCACGGDRGRPSLALGWGSGFPAEAGLGQVPRSPHEAPCLASIQLFSVSLAWTVMNVPRVFQPLTGGSACPRGTQVARMSSGP